MSVILAVLSAFVVVSLMSKYQTHSSTALGKVSAVLSVTTTLAEAWQKSHKIVGNLARDPLAVQLPASPSSSSTGGALVRRTTERDDPFYDENPSFLTGGIRGYSAYDPPRR